MMDWLARRKYLLLFVALLLLIVAYPMMEEMMATRTVLDVLLTLVFLGALQVIFKRRRLRWAGLVVGVPMFLGLWTDYVITGVPRLPLDLGLHVCGACFLGIGVAAILTSIHEEEIVSIDSIYGAFCGYLLTGLAFGHVYTLLEGIGPGSFHASQELADAVRNVDRGHYLLTYFSFVTLTTTGYGDITPSSSPARGFAVIEAICGQIYIAAVVAELIGKRVAQVLSNKQ